MVSSFIECAYREKAKSGGSWTGVHAQGGRQFCNERLNASQPVFNQ
jgi:hypothetical protein